MDDLQTSDALTFIPEQIEPVVFEAIELVLKDKIYNEKLVQGWVDEICCKITKDLIETNKPFKYVGKKDPSSMFLLSHSVCMSLSLTCSQFLAR
jgi:hypothetical protein